MAVVSGNNITLFVDGEKIGEAQSIEASVYSNLDYIHAKQELRMKYPPKPKRDYAHDVKKAQLTMEVDGKLYIRARG